MKPEANGGNPAARSSPRRYRYTKVADNRKHPIRGLWKRNGKFIARITVEGSTGKKMTKWVPLEAGSAAEAQEQFRKLLVERKENNLRHIGRSPKFEDYLDKTYLPWLETSGKKPDSKVTEKVHLNHWRKALGHLCLDKIRADHVNAELQSLKESGRSSRTRNLALVYLRNVLNRAKKVDKFLSALPVDDIPWEKIGKKAHRLYEREDIALFCEAALAASKNGEPFADYIRLLALTGAREQEAIKLQWANVDFTGKLLTIGADETDTKKNSEADTKNREPRHVNFSPELEAHLKVMRTRRAPDSRWMFPSPQRGKKDDRAKTYREALLLTRAAPGWACTQCGGIAFGETAPTTCVQCQGTRFERKDRALPGPLQRFGFHDCRHHFISRAVMSGIDYMTIAKWVGHKDGGVLIGKVYGHVNNQHTQAQAARLNFGPTIVEMPKAIGS